MKWAKGVPLKEILHGDRYSNEDGADEIENTIQILQKQYHLTFPYY